MNISKLSVAEQQALIAQMNPAAFNRSVRDKIKRNRQTAGLSVTAGESNENSNNNGQEAVSARNYRGFNIFSGLPNNGESGSNNNSNNNNGTKPVVKRSKQAINTLIAQETASLKTLQSQVNSVLQGSSTPEEKKTYLKDVQKQLKKNFPITIQSKKSTAKKIRPLLTLYTNVVTSVNLALGNARFERYIENRQAIFRNAQIQNPNSPILNANSEDILGKVSKELIFYCFNNVTQQNARNLLLNVLQFYCVPRLYLNSVRYLSGSFTTRGWNLTRGLKNIELGLIPTAPNIIPLIHGIAALCLIVDQIHDSNGTTSLMVEAILKKNPSANFPTGWVINQFQTGRDAFIFIVENNPLFSRQIKGNIYYYLANDRDFETLVMNCLTITNSKIKIGSGIEVIVARLNETNVRLLILKFLETKLGIVSAQKIKQTPIRTFRPNVSVFPFGNMIYGYDQENKGDISQVTIELLRFLNQNAQCLICKETMADKGSGQQSNPFTRFRYLLRQWAQYRPSSPAPAEMLHEYVLLFNETFEINFLQMFMIKIYSSTDGEVKVEITTPDGRVFIGPIISKDTMQKTPDVENWIFKTIGDLAIILICIALGIISVTGDRTASLFANILYYLSVSGYITLNLNGLQKTHTNVQFFTEVKKGEISLPAFMLENLSGEEKNLSKSLENNATRNGSVRRPGRVQLPPFVSTNSPTRQAELVTSRSRRVSNERQTTGASAGPSGR